jgi:hypothetical protein
MTAYLSYAGYDALTFDPNAVTQRGERIEVATEGLAIPTGNTVVTMTGAAAVSSFELEWNCATRAQLTELREFLDRRLGRFSPCFIPTYQRDLNVTSVGSFGKWIVDPGEAVAAMDLIATERSWQHWSIAGTILGGRGFGFQSDVDLVDPVNGIYWVRHGTNFILPAGPWTSTSGPWNSSNVIFSRAMFCRMATDSYRVRYLGQASIVTAEFIEVPAEPPIV